MLVKVTPAVPLSGIVKYAAFSPGAMAAPAPTTLEFTLKFPPTATGSTKKQAFKLSAIVDPKHKC